MLCRYFKCREKLVWKHFLSRKRAFTEKKCGVTWYFPHVQGAVVVTSLTTNTMADSERLKHLKCCTQRLSVKCLSTTSSQNDLLRGLSQTLGLRRIRVVTSSSSPIRWATASFCRRLLIFRTLAIICEIEMTVSLNTLSIFLFVCLVLRVCWLEPQKVEFAIKNKKK